MFRPRFAKQAPNYLLIMLFVLILAGCSTARPWQNSPIQPVAGKKSVTVAESTNAPSMVTVVSLSGGGARAAAFGLGVLQEMRDTHFEWEGRRTTLLDQLSVVSGVSGGSILAAYYAAFGDDGLNNFERDFLLQDIQTDLIIRALSPDTTYRLSSPWFGRSNVLAERLDQLYQGKTFADLAARKSGPELLITATDLTTGAPFQFTPEQFGLICSDITTVPLSFAVASSSAVPILLTPTSLRNYAGQCLSTPTTASSSEAATQNRYQRQLLEESAISYLNAKERPFIHLVDGGLADNLGVRSLLDRAIASGSIKDSFFRGVPPGSIRKIVLIVVNSERDMVERIDQSDEVPGLTQVVDALVFGAGSRTTQETLAMLYDTVNQWADEIARIRGTQNSPFAADAEIHIIPVSLHNVENSQMRRTLLKVPTAFTIDPEQVHQLVESGRSTLRTSPAFQKFLDALPGPHDH